MSVPKIFKSLVLTTLVCAPGIGFGGSGAWPLNLRGNATEEGGLSQKAVVVTFGAIAQNELTGAGGFTCRMGNAVSKRFSANGQLQLGSEAFGVVGVCEHRTSNLVEIVGQLRSGTVTKTVNITGNAQATGEITVINGRAFVTAQSTLVYSVNLEGVTPQ